MPAAQHTLTTRASSLDAAPVGFLSRLLVPRGVRRALHPVRTVRRAVTPKPVKQLRRALHPIDNAVYAAERALTTKGRKRATVYRHGGCPVKHRTAAAAMGCTKG